MGTRNRKRAIALAAFVYLSAWQGTASAAPDATVIADAVRRLNADHDQATAAVYLLQAGGARAARQIRDDWASLSMLGKRRAMVALAQLAKKHDAALEALVAAARSEDGDLSGRAFQTLQQTGAPGRKGLVALLSDPRVGDRAAAVLARAAPDASIGPLLDTMTAEGGAERPGLRTALVIAVQRAEGAEAPLRRWLATKPSTAAVASAALGLRSVDGHSQALASFIEYAASSAGDFASKWRLLQSAGSAGVSVHVDDWLGEQLATAPEWMLRRAAVDAVSSRGHRELVRPSLKDPYPRVRARAAAVLSGDPESLLDRATLARRDTWPMVRAEAVGSLRNEGEAVPVLVAAVDDSMSVVRSAAIEALALASHDQGWSRVQRRLRDRNEWPRVTEAAIAYVVAHCRADSVDSLLQVVMRAAPSNALTDDLNNAARAIEALEALGTEEARSALDLLRGTEGVPPTLKIALEQPPAEDGGCAGARR